MDKENARKSFTRKIWLVTKNLYRPFLKCNICNNSGKIMDIGGIEKNCNQWYCQRNLLKKTCELIFWVNRLRKDWVALISTLLILILVLLFIPFVKNYPSFVITTVLTLIGLMFAALKYKLDKANYHKDLFSKRYEILQTLDEILQKIGQNKDENSSQIIELLDSIYRKSYLLFGKKSYTFFHAACYGTLTLLARF